MSEIYPNVTDFIFFLILLIINIPALLILKKAIFMLQKGRVRNTFVILVISTLLSLDPLLYLNFVNVGPKTNMALAVIALIGIIVFINTLAHFFISISNRLVELRKPGFLFFQIASAILLAFIISGTVIMEDIKAGERVGNLTPGLTFPFFILIAGSCIIYVFSILCRGVKYTSEKLQFQLKYIFRIGIISFIVIGISAFTTTRMISCNFSLLTGYSGLILVYGAFLYILLNGETLYMRSQIAHLLRDSDFARTNNVKVTNDFVHKLRFATVDDQEIIQSSKKMRLPSLISCGDKYEARLNQIADSLLADPQADRIIEFFEHVQRNKISEEFLMWITRTKSWEKPDSSQNGTAR